MGRYWIDADVLIQAKNGLYSFDIAPPFWSWIDEQAERGVLCSSTEIYKEILGREAKDDPLAKWAKTRKSSGMFVHPGRQVQDAYRELGDHCMQKYARRQAKVGQFLSGGDGWIIAHARCDKGVVVSHESRVDKSSLTPKIPNVCSDFEIQCISLAELLAKLNFHF